MAKKNIWSKVAKLQKQRKENKKNLKDYYIQTTVVWCKAGHDQGGTWEDEPTAFVTEDEKTLQCGNCLEKLGVLTDENIEHQSEYHSCPDDTKED